TRRANLAVRSPVPPAMSSTRWPGRTPDISMVKCFHRRWMPPDIRSFIRSYLAATEWNTRETWLAFSATGTCLNPKWVYLSSLMDRPPKEGGIVHRGFGFHVAGCRFQGSGFRFHAKARVRSPPAQV